ncbi:MAG: hypothetical protein GY953_29085, partial [bacterium]|nr:hypothetical protein [bacterium]
MSASSVGMADRGASHCRSTATNPLGFPRNEIFASTAAETDLTDGRVSYIDDRRLRAVCRDRNTDVSVRLDLEQGTGVLLLRSNHVSSFAARELSGEKIELRGSG